MNTELGPVFTAGHSYRARAEARQREYRARLGVAHGKYGHSLDEDAASKGQNFVTSDAFEAARARQHAGKGVAPRTFENMLSSQAMCFNIFAPLAKRLDLASAVLREFIPGLEAVTAIYIEHTPQADVFGDQSGRGGVDCDVLAEGRLANGARLVQVIETKFVEPEFSVCGFRRPGRTKEGRKVCPDTVTVIDDRTACLYARDKGYRYWERTDEHGLLRDGALAASGCPFAGARWQLWVNLALAHEEARRRGAEDARFAVCSSAKNTALLGSDGEVLRGFCSLLRRPDSVGLIDLDKLLGAFETLAPPELAGWAEGLAARYRGI